VQSPDATSLPVKLAVGLLKDRDGKIDIDLPIRGDLNDPDFRYGKMVVQTLMNLLKKVAASPFKVVGGLLGGKSEHDLQHVTFEAGASEITPPEAEKLTGLAKALQERPALRLEVAGAADPSRDRAALAAMQLDAQLRRMQGAGGKHRPKEASEQPLGEEEQRSLMMQLYVEKLGPLPVQPKGAAPPSADSMKAQLLEAMPVSEADLRELAQARATHIRDYLVSQAQMPPEHIFLLEPRMAAVPGDGAISADLNLTSE